MRVNGEAYFGISTIVEKHFTAVGQRTIKVLIEAIARPALKIPRPETPRLKIDDLRLSSVRATVTVLVPWQPFALVFTCLQEAIIVSHLWIDQDAKPGKKYIFGFYFAKAYFMSLWDKTKS